MNVISVRMVTVYQLKLSGSMLAGLEQKQNIILEIRKMILKKQDGLIIPYLDSLKYCILLANMTKIHGVCMICMGMYGSGCRIGMGVIRAMRRWIHRGRRRARTASFGAAPSALPLGTCGRRLASTPRRPIATTPSGSAC